VGYNPKKPGRPSHCYHTYSVAGPRLVLDLDVRAGNEHTSKHSAPGLWALLDRTARDCWPTLLRGDASFGNEPITHEAEQRGLAYLFELRLTANVQRAIERLSSEREWSTPAKAGRPRRAQSGWRVGVDSVASSCCAGA
jgi:Transposase DDE domain group 1